MNRDKDFVRGSNYVRGLLRLRPRSEKEIRDKLKVKKYESKALEELVAYFKNLNYINDREFAKAWLESRLRKPLGFKAIRAELIQKGVDSEIIEELLSQKSRNFNEAMVVQELAEKRFNKLRGKQDSAEKIKDKLYGYLLRRGFSNDIIIGVIGNLIKT